MVITELMSAFMATEELSDYGTCQSTHDSALKCDVDLAVNMMPLTFGHKPNT